jgi:hypothetical protein
MDVIALFDACMPGVQIMNLTRSTDGRTPFTVLLQRAIVEILHAGVHGVSTNQSWCRIDNDENKRVQN